MKNFLLVFLGGGLGSCCRFLLSKLNNSYLPFPFGTLSANVLGSLILGIAMGFFFKNHLSTQGQILIVTGFCGGFTTFSSFAFENQEFLKNGQFSLFLIYSFGSLVLALLAVAFGIWLAKFF